MSSKIILNKNRQTSRYERLILRNQWGIRFLAEHREISVANRFKVIRTSG